MVLILFLLVHSFNLHDLSLETVLDWDSFLTLEMLEKENSNVRQTYYLKSINVDEANKRPTWSSVVHCHWTFAGRC